MTERNRKSIGPEDSRIISGGLLHMLSLGILIVGDSGVGKSETALELILRGHHFISDDVTQVFKESGQVMGRAPELSRDFMEIRGMGIINIRHIFGADALLEKTAVDLVIELKKWEEGREYDRLGLKYYGEHTVLDEKIPQMSMPVAPGRNMATLIEVACKVHLLREQGYHAPEEIIKTLNRALTTGALPTDREK
ncbi:MAG: hypothetical protein KKD56_04650 [Acidobacteria bacterium]|nr:hypothetical protein [Acidobacteriota bacterium]MBU1475516.1 hypothetical protein [Acidobacteriota bacterium]